MSDDATPTGKPTVSRRGALGILGAGAAAAPLLGVTAADAAPAAAPANPAFVPSKGSGATPVQGLHLTFGPDPARTMVASWITDGSVSRPRVVCGTLEGGFGGVAQAQTRTYVDGTSGRTVWIHHAEIDRLCSGTDYIYAVQHDGATRAVSQGTPPRCTSRTTT
jgi:hypothetical protein